MDSVRFGRALGFGARSAAKALAGAVDAATAPSPTAARAAAAPAPVSQSAPAKQPVPAPASFPTSGRTGSDGPVATAARSAARFTSQAQQVGKGISRGRKRFGQAAWRPFVKVSSVLWLEMTGAFFGIFALSAAQATWTHRAALHSTESNHDAHRNVFVFLGMALIFGYFCISSFIRARRKQRST